ncbi:MAG: hypothetical protein ABIN21_05150, partial [candidate division WOR-3 bacterium]
AFGFGILIVDAERDFIFLPSQNSSRSTFKVSCPILGHFPPFPFYKFNYFRIKSLCLLLIGALDLGIRDSILPLRFPKFLFP